jgi:hypothetical protein
MDRPPPPEPNDDDTLRRRIRDRIADGTLPAAMPHRYSSRPADGVRTCVVCDRRPAADETAYEAASAETIVFPLHRDCLVLWMLEIR